MPEKNQKIDIVSMLIIRELVKLERPRINIQKLAEKADVSRPWIYKYFGSTEDDIISTAIDCLAPQFTEHGKVSEINTPKDWAKAFLKTLELALIKVEKYPEVYQAIYSSMVIPNNFTERIKHHETIFKEKHVVPQVKKVFGVSNDEARSFADLIQALRFGIMLQWLREDEKTPLKKKKLLREIQRRIFDQFKT